LEQNWENFDTNNDGQIEINEFVKLGGLFDFIKENVKYEEIIHPKLTLKSMTEWFNFWD